MKRLIGLILVLTLLGASSAPAPVPKAASVQELGTVLATLNDWRSILVVSFAIIGVLVLLVAALVAVIVRVATGRSANDQATLAALQANTKASTELAEAVRALEMINARREAERQ